MRCSCPKCTVKIEVDASLITEEGSYTPCPECKSRFWMNQESTARRALKKEGNIYCAKCGNELDHLIVCRGCGYKFPDYFLVQVSKPVRRKAGKSDRSMGFALKPVTQTYALPSQSTTVSRKPLVMVIGLLVIAALVTSGAFFYHKTSLEKQYAENFILVLSGTKAGAELSLADCAKVSTEWKMRMDAGQNYIPSIPPEDAARLNKAKDRAEKNMQKLSTPPEKFVAANENLTKLVAAYNGLLAVTLKPSGSLASFTETVRNSENDFKLAAKALKDNLPAELAEEINQAKPKYIELRDF